MIIFYIKKDNNIEVGTKIIKKVVVKSVFSTTM